MKKFLFHISVLFGLLLTVSCEMGDIIADAQIEVLAKGKVECSPTCPKSASVALQIEFGQKRSELPPQRVNQLPGKFDFTFPKVLIGYRKSEVAEWNKRIIASVKAEGCQTTVRNFALVALPHNEQMQLILDLGEIQLRCS